MRWLETPFDHLTALADPMGRGLVTSLDGSDVAPPPMRRYRRPKMVTIRGVRYYSYRHAADTMGINIKTVSQADRDGTLESLKPCHWWEINGHEFETIREASEYYAVSKTKIRKQAKKVYMKMEGII
jgi:hypothetical protein